MGTYDDRSFDDPSFHLAPVDVEILARGLSAMASSIRACQIGSMTGFEMTLPMVDPQPYEIERRILVSQDGADVVLQGTYGTRWQGQDRQWRDHGEELGSLLQRAGLGSRVEFPSPAAPVVAKTIGRMDAAALRVLKSVPEFGPEAYRIAMSIEPGSAYDLAIRAYPAIAAELDQLRWASHEIARRQVVETGLDPVRSVMSEYVSAACGHAQDLWPSIEIDRDRVSRVSERVGSFVCLERGGLEPWQMAFLSLGSDRCIPTDREQTRYALRFASRWHEVLGDRFGMDPAHLFDEVEGRFGADWKSVWQAMEVFEARVPPVLIDEIGEVVASKLATEDGVGAYDALGSSRIGVALCRRLAEGRGLVEFQEIYQARMPDVIELPDRTDPSGWNEQDRHSIEERYQALTSSLMPDGLGVSSARELLLRIDFDMNELAPLQASRSITP